MAFSYVGVSPNQKIKNSGVLSLDDINNLESTGELGGSLEHIKTVTFNSTTSAIDITDIKESKYDVHLIQLTAINNGSGGSFYLRTSQDNGSNFDDATGDYQFSILRMWYGATYESYNSNATVIELYGQGGNGNQPTNRYIYIYNAGNSSKYTSVTTQSTGWDDKLKSTFGGGVRDDAHVVNAIRLYTNVGGGFESATAKLYGIKQI